LTVHIDIDYCHFLLFFIVQVAFWQLDIKRRWWWWCWWRTEPILVTESHSF